MVFYALGYFSHKTASSRQARKLYRKAGQMPPDYCFPARLEELLVLEDAVSVDPENGKAFYHLGNLLYDKRRYEEAIEAWERSCKLESGFSIPWRNLGIAYYNIRRDPEKAEAAYRQAFEINPRDTRVLYELDQLRKKIAISSQKRLAFLEQHLELVNQRDDLSLERVTQLNQTGQPGKALEILCTRRFHPWEGGERLVSGQYVWAHLLLGLACLDSEKAAEALDHFEAARCYPENLGEGKHLLACGNRLHYFAGLAHEAPGEPEDAKRCFERACRANSDHSPMIYYSALALKKLGDEKASCKMLYGLLDCALRQEATEVKIDYFATSPPNFLPFDDGPQKRNRIDCLLLAGLARSGLGQQDQAEEKLRQVLALDVNHLWTQLELERLAQCGKNFK